MSWPGTTGTVRKGDLVFGKLFAALGVAALGLSMLLPAPAMAQRAPDSFYLELRAGAVFLDDADFDAGGSSGEIDFDAGGLVEGAAGYAHSSGFRGEIALGYRENELDRLRFNGGGASKANGDLGAFTTMANVLYDLDLGDLGVESPELRKLVPHLGGGFGFAVLTLDPDFGDSDSEVEFAFQAIVGLSYHFTPNWAASFSYAFLGTSDPDFDGDFETEYTSHNILFGARYSF